MTMKLIQIVLLYPTQYFYKKINNQIFNNPVIYKLRFLPVFRRFQFITFFPNRICIDNYLFLFLPQYQDTLKRHRSLTRFLQAPLSCAIFCTSFQFLPIFFYVRLQISSPGVSWPVPLVFSSGVPGQGSPCDVFMWLEQSMPPTPTFSSLFLLQQGLGLFSATNCCY